MNRLYSIQLLQAQNETRLILPFQLCFPIIFEDRKRIPQFFASIHVSKSRALEENHWSFFLNDYGNFWDYA